MKYTVKDVADILGTSTETIRRWARRGELIGTCTSNKHGWLFDGEDLNKFFLTDGHRYYHKWAAFYPEEVSFIDFGENSQPSPKEIAISKFIRMADYIENLRDDIFDSQSLTDTIDNTLDYVLYCINNEILSKKASK